VDAPTADIVGALAEVLGRTAREHAPCAECGEPHGVETECYALGVFATPPTDWTAFNIETELLA